MGNNPRLSFDSGYCERVLPLPNNRLKNPGFWVLLDSILLSDALSSAPHFLQVSAEVIL